MAIFSKNVGAKAELPQVGIFFQTQFPSLGIFINKKVGNIGIEVPAVI